MKSYRQELIEIMPRAKEVWSKICSIGEEEMYHQERIDVLAEQKKILLDELEGYTAIFTKQQEAEEKLKEEKLADEDHYDEHRDNLLASENENGQ
jgi:hypothetical protein